MTNWKKLGVGVGLAGIAVAAGIGLTKALCRGLKFTFEAPVSIRVCEPFVMKGDVIKDCKGLKGVPVTIYTEIIGVPFPLTTVITDSAGHYEWRGVIGTDAHFENYGAIELPFWAEATIEGELQRTDRVYSTLYGEACDGPCPVGTIRLRLAKKGGD